MVPRILTLVVVGLLSPNNSLQAAEPKAENVIVTVAGTGKSENNGDGPAKTANISQPFGVEVGPDGALYVAEVGNHRIRRVDLNRAEISTFAGSGKAGYSGDDGPATEAALNEPYEIRFDEQGNLFFVEMQNHVVRKVDAATGKLTTVAGTGRPGFSGDGGPATKAQLRQPHSIALDSRGGLYIADIGNYRVRRVDLASGRIETFSGTGEKKLPADGDPADGASLAGPRALFILGDEMWLALREGHSLWKTNLAAEQPIWRHIAGSGKAGYSGDGGPARLATFNGPKGVAVDSKGNILLVDTENQVIRLIDSRGAVSTIAGRGPKFRGGKGDGEDPTLAELDRPHGICVDAQGRVYIGDTENHRVRSFPIP